MQLHSRLHVVLAGRLASEAAAGGSNAHLCGTQSLVQLAATCAQQLQVSCSIQAAFMPSALRLYCIFAMSAIALAAICFCFMQYSLTGHWSHSDRQLHPSSSSCSRHESSSLFNPHILALQEGLDGPDTPVAGSHQGRFVLDPAEEDDDDPFQAVSSCWPSQPVCVKAAAFGSPI